MKAKRISILTYEGDRCQGDLVQRKLLALLNEAGGGSGDGRPDGCGLHEADGHHHEVPR
jgi:hypothetical protein